MLLLSRHRKMLFGVQLHKRSLHSGTERQTDSISQSSLRSLTSSRGSDGARGKGEGERETCRKVGGCTLLEAPRGSRPRQAEQASSFAFPALARFVFSKSSSSSAAGAAVVAASVPSSRSGKQDGAGPLPTPTHPSRPGSPVMHISRLSCSRSKKNWSTPNARFAK